MIGHDSVRETDFSLTRRQQIGAFAAGGSVKSILAVVDSH